MRAPRFEIVSDGSSSEDEDDDEYEDEDGTVALGTLADAVGYVPGAGSAAVQQRRADKIPKMRMKMTANAEAAECRVCRQLGHRGGYFVAGVYVDCPNKPCFLCRGEGHTTSTCPYRYHGRVESGSGGGGSSPGSHNKRRAEKRGLSALSSREIRVKGNSGAPLVHRPNANPASWGNTREGRDRQWCIDSAIIKLFSRRVTCLAFHPYRDDIIVAADKFGKIAVWDTSKVGNYETLSYCKHRDGSEGFALVNVLKVLGGDGGADWVTGAGDVVAVGTASDGTCRAIDLESQTNTILLNVNPQGWRPGGEKENKDWQMLGGMDTRGGVVYVGDDSGRLHVVDPRAPSSSGAQTSWRVHKTGTKVTTVNFNPVDPHLLLTAGNDGFVRVYDVRGLPSAGSGVEAGRGKGAEMCLSELEHPRVVNCADWSPWSGSKILTTCQDNRLRVYENAAALPRGGKAADVEIVHSHDFNRYLTPFKARWCPTDVTERLCCVGRYISDDFAGRALHPIDLFDASTGALVGELTDPNIETISPVAEFHPRLEGVLASASSRNLYLWKLRTDKEVDELNAREAERMNTDGGLPPGFYDVEPSDPTTAKKKKKMGASDD